MAGPAFDEGCLLTDVKLLPKGKVLPARLHERAMQAALGWFVAMEPDGWSVQDVAAVEAASLLLYSQATHRKYTISSVMHTRAISRVSFYVLLSCKLSVHDVEPSMHVGRVEFFLKVAHSGIGGAAEEPLRLAVCSLYSFEVEGAMFVVKEADPLSGTDVAVEVRHILGTLVSGTPEGVEGRARRQNRDVQDVGKRYFMRFNSTSRIG